MNNYLPIIILSIFTTLTCKISLAQDTKSSYPRTAEYFSIIVPIATLNDKGVTANFSNSTTLGFPTGINWLKSDNFGYSFELTPFIRSENGLTKVNSILFHPGAMFRFERGFTFISRLAFETNGRFGFTPVFNQVVSRKQDYFYFLAFSTPARFGNDVSASLGANLQFGIGF